jgi:HK97 family phage major capsid protein
MTPSPKLAQWEKRAATGLSEGIGADGGFLVQTDYSTDLLRAAFDTGKLAKLCRKYRISGNSNSIKIPGVDETSRASTRWGGILHYWADEAAEKTKSKPKFRRIELNLNKMIGLCYATDELLQDAGALETYVRQGFAEEFGFALDDAIINGTGAGRPLGILSAGSTISVSKETGQAANTIVHENLTKMYSRVLNPENAVWLINQNCLPELFNLYLAIGTGGSALFTMDAHDAPRMRLMGLPVIICEQCQTLGTTGDIWLANFKDGYVVADKGGTQVDKSIHCRFIYDESVFRFVYRVDAQPILASAIQPYKGGSSYTRSHFVKLDTRS